ncbi:protein amalgam-like isoform X2 [Palaemon carinicauda]|uniref:protein amalgam-like isoform X2 n=1 Tax=Palaemon carinicauda TaxID=392227 RepID=UPI0035B5BCAC
MWMLSLCLVWIYGMGSSLGQVGSPWHTGAESDYYYEQLHPEDDLPVITTDEQQFAVNLGEPLIIPCPVHNLGQFTLVWRRGNQILWVLQDRGEGSFVQVVSRDPRINRNGTSLIINGVLPDDESIYTCEISTNPPRSISHTLTVKVPPTVYPANNRTSMLIKMGGTANLTCTVTGNPMPKVTWTKEGSTQPLGEGVALTKTNAKAEDNGIYRCTADNGAGDPVHSSINLQVMHPPDVMVDKSEVYSGVSYDATLACFVNATPRPQVKWYRENGSPVDPLRLRVAYDTINRKHSLQFDRVRKDDFGYYTCNASNFMGNSSALVRLTGRPKPVRFSSPKLGEKDTKYTLVWEVESYSPVLAYNIAYRNETDSDEKWVNFTVPGTTSSSMYHSKEHTLTDLEPGASYYVQISAKNEFGSSDINETFAFTTFDPVGTDPPDDLLHEEVIPNTDQYQDVVSEVGGVTESQAPPLPEVDIATAQSSIISPTDNMTEMEEIFQEIFKENEIPPAEKASVSDGTSETFSLTPREKRAQMVALVTAISLSSFFF